MKKKIIKIVIAVVLFAVIAVGLLSWGVISGIGFIKNSVTPVFSGTNITSGNKNNATSSKTANGFKTLSSYNLLAASITTSEDVKSKQKIILINPGMFFSITKQDIESNIIQSQLKTMTSLGPVQIINFDKFEIAKKGSFEIDKQNVPYVKGSFGGISGGKVRAEGIIGVIDTAAGKNNIFISTTASGKIKLKIVEDFFKQDKKKK
ncbi:MAG: hypothetical protein WCG23_08575 [bacterium]